MILFAAMIGFGVHCAMILAWRTQRATGQSGFVDAIWAGATGVFALTAIVFAPWPPAAPGRAILVAGLVALWAARLSGHIFFRARGAAEDPRYAELARRWGPAFSWRLLLFLQAQAVAAWPLIVAAVCAAHAERGFPDFFDALGLLVALAALGGEAVADRQMQAFRRDRASLGPALCRDGLWAWSRHPNYFCEFLFWCALPLIAGPNVAGLAALSAPVAMYGLLVHVSGLPPLEAHLRATRGAAFDAYAREVNGFFPGPPRVKTPRPPESRECAGSPE